MVAAERRGPGYCNPDPSSDPTKQWEHEYEVKCPAGTTLIPIPANEIPRIPGDIHNGRDYGEVTVKNAGDRTLPVCVAPEDGLVCGVDHDGNAVSDLARCQIGYQCTSKMALYTQCPRSSWSCLAKNPEQLTHGTAPHARYYNNPGPVLNSSSATARGKAIEEGIVSDCWYPSWSPLALMLEAKTASAEVRTAGRRLEAMPLAPRPRRPPLARLPCPLARS